MTIKSPRVTRPAAARRIGELYPVETSQVVVGDRVVFFEDVFGGPFRAPLRMGERCVEAKVAADSYSTTGERWLVLEIIGGYGFMPPLPESRVRRAERTVHLHGCKRAAWSNEDDRVLAGEEVVERRTSAIEAAVARADAAMEVA